MDGRGRGRWVGVARGVGAREMGVARGVVEVVLKVRGLLGRWIVAEFVVVAADVAVVLPEYCYSCPFFVVMNFCVRVFVGDGVVRLESMACVRHVYLSDKWEGV